MAAAGEKTWVGAPLTACAGKPPSPLGASAAWPTQLHVSFQGEGGRDGGNVTPETKAQARRQGVLKGIKFRVAASFLLLFSWFQEPRNGWGNQRYANSRMLRNDPGEPQRTAACPPFPTMGLHPALWLPAAAGVDPEFSCKFCLAGVTPGHRLWQPG